MGRHAIAFVNSAKIAYWFFSGICCADGRARRLAGRGALGHTESRGFIGFIKRNDVVGEAHCRESKGARTERNHGAADSGFFNEFAVIGAINRFRPVFENDRFAKNRDDGRNTHDDGCQANASKKQFRSIKESILKGEVMNRSVTLSLITCGFLLSAMVVLTNAHADESQPNATKPQKQPNDARFELARQLFEEAAALRRQGRHAEACKAYLASYAEFPHANSAFQLGKCHEARGETVRAQRMFEIVAKLSRDDGMVDAAEEALERAKSLEARHSTVVINVAPEAARIHHLSVFLDGVLVLPTDWNKKRIPLDAGTHEVRAAAPHYNNYAVRVAIEATTSARHIDIPSLTRKNESPRDDTTTITPTSKRKEHILLGTFGAVEAVGVIMLLTSFASNAAPERIPEHARTSLGFASLPFIVGGGIGIGWGYDAYRSRIAGQTNAAIIPRITPSRIGFDLTAPF